VALEIEHLFVGNAIARVDPDGALRLPDFVRTVLDRRGNAENLVVAVHEADPCLTLFDRGYERRLMVEEDGRRRRDEDADRPLAHHRRARRTFGFAEEARTQSEARLRLPPMMRRRGRIGDYALFVGTGGAVELWDARLACEADDPDLREIALYRLESVAPVQPEGRDR
jgi:MraZ protein